MFFLCFLIRVRDGDYGRRINGGGKCMWIDFLGFRKFKEILNENY